MLLRPLPWAREATKQVLHSIFIRAVLIKPRHKTVFLVVDDFADARLKPRVLRSGKIKVIPDTISSRDRVLTGLIRDPRRMIFTETDLQTLVTPFLTETSGSEEEIRVPTDLSRTSMMSG